MKLVSKSIGIYNRYRPRLAQRQTNRHHRRVYLIVSVKMAFFPAGPEVAKRYPISNAACLISHILWPATI
ncbi:hypothetical protein [Xenorhabdus littoralis]|uniref:hypothetical protein n=1 Tax=Xenorhabdus littoralis TaxID=2582835 RepID=UPI0029E8165F|nr:hypothetical protein [Xenorhabdus sp. Reich]